MWIILLIFDFFRVYGRPFAVDFDSTVRNSKELNFEADVFSGYCWLFFPVMLHTPFAKLAPPRYNLEELEKGGQMRWRNYYLLILSLLLVTGCGRSSPAFTDDFSNPDSGWGGASTEPYLRGYHSGKYQIRIDVPEWFIWTLGGHSYQDVSATVTVYSEGDPDNHYGLICRASEAGFYYFAISADGYYAIFRYTEDGELLPLTGPAMLRSPAIRQQADNQLLALCQESTLTLYVNGELVAQIEDEALSAGDVGMAAGTLPNSAASLAWFDDLQVSQP